MRYRPVVTDIEPMLLAVARGEGIVFLPSAAHFYPRPGIVYLDVVDLPPSTSALAWPDSHPNRPALAALRRAAQATWRKNGEPRSR